MSSELEERLAAAFAALPGPGSDAEARARGAALGALASPARGRARRLVAVLAAVGAVLAAGAAALAAIGTIHVSVGAPTHSIHADRSRLELPRGIHGIALVEGGRLWLTAAHGLRIEGLPVSAAALSPHALYVAVGLGRSLVVMAPDGRRAWALPAAGRVRAAAWAPSALEIAYVVDTGRRLELRVVEGDGDHERLVDAGVAAVTPSWRRDSLALGYVGAGGRAVVYDLAHRSRRLLPRCGGAVRALAFAPRGWSLAGVARGAVLFDRPGRCVRVESAGTPALAWSGGGIVVVAGGRLTRVPLRIGSATVAAGQPSPVSWVASSPGGGLVTVTSRGVSLRGVALLQLEQPGRITSVAVR